MTELTPQAIRSRALAARVSVNKLLKRAGVSCATLWRWEQDRGPTPQPMTLGKIQDALEAFEAERAGKGVSQ